MYLVLLRIYKFKLTSYCVNGSNNLYKRSKLIGIFFYIS